MLGILDRFDQANITTMKHIHQLLQNFGMSEERAKEELIDTLDDGGTWTDGALFKPAFKNITVCYMLYAIICHFHYSLADVLRMNNFSKFVAETLTLRVCFKTLRKNVISITLPFDSRESRKLKRISQWSVSDAHTLYYYMAWAAPAVL